MKIIKFFLQIVVFLFIATNFTYAQLNDATVTISGSTNVCPGDHTYTLQISA